MKPLCGPMNPPMWAHEAPMCAHEAVESARCYSWPKMTRNVSSWTLNSAIHVAIFSSSSHLCLLTLFSVGCLYLFFVTFFVTRLWEKVTAIVVEIFILAVVVGTRH